MQLQPCDDAVRSSQSVVHCPSSDVILADGTRRNLDSLDPGALKALQWEQEQAFVRRILAAPKGSRRRTEITCQAYDTVTRIVAHMEGIPSRPLVMGLDARYEQLVVRLLQHQKARGLTPRFFEIGYAGGALLKQVSARGFPVAGIEVSSLMHEEACRLLGPTHAENLLVGDFAGGAFGGGEPRYSMVYWNDVFEHIPPDEILDYLRKIHGLLVPGGLLVTITPNWHIRPSDVTGDLCPPRTEAAGLHLKEYTLREVTGLLGRAGFRRVRVPLFLTHRRIVLWGDGLAAVKQLFEPSLEWLPFPLADILCRGFGLSCTIAARGD